MTEAHTLYMEWGKVGGKLISSERQVVLKKQCNTIEEQLWSEATSRHRDKLQEGYKEYNEDSEPEHESLTQPQADIEQEVEEITSSLDCSMVELTRVPLCMLGTDIESRWSKITYPMWAQAKRDGVRCLAMWDGDQVGLYSRTRHPWKFLSHLRKSLTRVLSSHPGLVLDGEFYSHGMHPQTITSIVGQKTTPHPDEHKIELHVFDCVTLDAPGTTYSKRRERLEELLVSIPSVVIVEEYLITDKDVLEEVHERHRLQKYEGTMLRPDLPYNHGRDVYSLLKYKFNDEMDSTIVAVTEDSKGTEAGCAMFTLLLPNGKKTTIRPTGSLESRREWLADPSLVMGKIYTFHYSGLTKAGMPKAIKNGRIRIDL